MTVIVAATANTHKFEEYNAMLGGQGAELQSLLDYPGFTPSEETGKTFKENASQKALEACIYTDRPTFADDSGLEITATSPMPTASPGSCVKWKAKATAAPVLSVL